MSKKVQFILIPILLLSLAGGIIYYFFNKPEGDYPNAVYALPDNSIAVWQGKDVQHTSTTFTESGIFKYFLQNAEVADFNANISYFDSIFNKVDELKEALKVSSLLVSAHLTGNEKCGLLFLLQIQNKLDKTSFTKIIKRIEPGYSFTERNFEGYILYDIKNENKESMFCVAFIKGIFAISASPILVEDAIAAYKYHGRKLPDLHEEIKNATTKDKVFLNYKYVSNFIASHLSADYQKEVTALGNNLSFGEYDYKTDESNISLSGTIPASTSSKNYLDIFIGMKPAKMEILDVIPSKSFALICNEVSSLDAFLKRYNEIAPNTETRNADLKNLETKYATTFPELTKWIGNEWGYSMLESKENSRDSLEEILFVKSADTNNIVDALRQLNTKTGAKQTSKNTYRQYAIEPFAMGEILPLAFGEFYRKMNHPFYCIIGNYVAFANTPSSLKNAIDAYLDNQTISQASSAKAFMKNLSTDCNFLLYINPSRAADLGKKYIRENIASAYETNLPLLKGLEGFGFQVSAAGEHLYNTIILTKPSASDETVEVGWSTHLEAEMIGKPSIISNSDTKAKEVFVQDEKFTLYLLNADGVIIWKKKLDAQISGGVEPISLYGDGNTQYIFATKNSLYMLKHNGENAGNYPLHLGSRATSPLAVFNFNGTQNFNYFIGTQNNRIYGYHANGKPLSGWNPQMLDAPLVQPLKTAFIDGENYLFGVSNRGTFYLWNTAGDKLIKPREFHRKPTSPAYLKAAEKLEKSAFYFADTAATVTEIYPKGNATRFYTDGSGMPACFNCIMPTQNQKPLFSISSKKHIYTYEKGGKGFWKINAETLVDLPFVNCQINGKNYIAYGSSLTNQIYLSTLDGKKFKGFPVNGNTEFIIDDINQDGTPDLICGGQGRMVYLYLVK